MREIKFRAWHKASQKMEYEGHNEYPGGGSSYISKTTMFMYGEDAEIMQFTGLMDKKGKEIYEEDILREKDGMMWRVRWWRGSFWFVNVEDESNLNTYDWLISNKIHWTNFWEDGQYEVIGNIYENPELIK